MAKPFPWYGAIVLALMGLCPAPFSTPARGQAGADPARPVLRVAYFVPNDREPEPDSIVRLDRVLTDVQRFYGGLGGQAMITIIVASIGSVQGLWGIRCC